MMALLDTSHDLDICAEEIGCEVGQLLTPLTRYRLRDSSRPWAIDNGAYSEFDEAAFWSLLAREKHRRQSCLFVTVPDVVGSARRTREVFQRWAPKLDGWNLAYAVQDGQENVDIPWDAIAFVFLGGSTEFKCGPIATQIIKAAKLLGCKVHVGRVNDSQRWKHFDALSVDTADGTGIARYSEMRKAIREGFLQQEMISHWNGDADDLP
jgi:hypothetical protein